jgi:transcriptional regulator with XRE-family HTH domain
MAKRAIEIAAVGSRVAENLEHLRAERRLSQTDLSALLKRLGRQMSAYSISKIETTDRRIDVDDLVALAVALDTTPNRLLLPAAARETDDVELTPEVRTSAVDAWRWAAGEEPLPIGVLPPTCQEAVRDDHGRATFRRENQPHMRPEVHIGSNLQQHSDLMRSIEAIVRLAQIRGVPLAELDRYLGYSYVIAVSDDQTDSVTDHLPGARG